MFRKIDDFIHQWDYETSATVKIFTQISDESSGQKIYDHGRTIKLLAWHLTHTLTEMMSKVGIFEKDLLENSPIPEKMEMIIELYSKYALQIKEGVLKNWTDEDLIEKVNMYGEEWTRGQVLWVLIVHQIHHRGQLTVLLRQAGLKVPGIYGPSREEWEAMGMKAME